MTPKSPVAQILRESLNRATSSTDTGAKTEAQRVLDYDTSVPKQIEDLTAQYLPLYTDTENASIAQSWKDRPKAVFNLTRAIRRKLCTLYSDRVTRTFADKSTSDAWGQIKTLNRIMSAADKHSFLGGAVAVRPMIVKGKRTFGIYQRAMLDYVPMPGEPMTPAMFSVSWTEGTGSSQVLVAQYWTPTIDNVPGEYCETVDGTLTGNIEPNRYGIPPFFIFRNDLDAWSFFGQPASDLIHGNLILNKLATDLDWTVLFQIGGTLVTKGAPDTFKPRSGANRHLRLPANPDADASYINPGADIAGAVAAILQNLDLFFASVGVPQGAIFITEQSKSGVAIVAEQETLREYRKERINTFGPQEAEFIQFAERIFRIDEGHPLPAGMDIEPPQIQYTELQRPMSTEQMNEDNRDYDLGLKTPADTLAARLNISRDEAVQRIRDNKQLMRDLTLPALPGTVTTVEDEV
jgi:hypothetical protein